MPGWQVNYDVLWGQTGPVGYHNRFYFGPGMAGAINTWVYFSPRMAGKKIIMGDELWINYPLSIAIINCPLFEPHHFLTSLYVFPSPFASTTWKR